MIFGNSLHLIFNKILSSNEGSLNILRKYHGKSFKLNLIGFHFSGLIEADGLITKPVDETYTVEITIPLSTASYLIHQDRLATYKEITFHGDQAFGRELLEILSNLHFSGVYSNASPVTLLFVNQFSKAIQAIKNNLSLIQSNVGTSVSEYLLYETEDLVTHYELEEFCNAVDELNSRTDRLTARINLLSESTL